MPSEDCSSGIHTKSVFNDALTACPSLCLCALILYSMFRVFGFFGFHLLLRCITCAKSIGRDYSTLLCTTFQIDEQKISILCFLYKFFTTNSYFMTLMTFMSKPILSSNKFFWINATLVMLWILFFPKFILLLLLKN